MLAPLLNVSRRESSTALHDDSLRKHPRIGPLSVGIASLNRRLQMDYPLTGKGFVSFGDRARSRREDVAKLCFALNVGTLLCDVSWESTRYANVPKACPYILAVLQHPPWCGERSCQLSDVRGAAEGDFGAGVVGVDCDGAVDGVGTAAYRFETETFLSR